MSWYAEGGRPIVQAIDETSTTQNHDVGLIVRCVNRASTSLGSGDFIYLKGVASTAVGSLVKIDDDFDTSLATANDVGLLAVAMSANVASQWGWYQLTGKAVVKVLTGFAADLACYLTATAGSIDDTVVAGDLIYNMAGMTAIGTPAAGQAYCHIAHPYVNNT